MAMTLMYNGVQFAPVTTKRSMVIPYSAEGVWSVAKMFGRAASWMGSIEGQRSFSQLLGVETVDHIGAVRVFGVGDKMLFEQLVKLDNQDMIIGWQLMTHPMNSNPFPAAFVNFKAELQVWPISIPSNSNQCFVEWRMDLLTEQHAVAHMTKAMNDIMVMSLTNLTNYMDRRSSNSGGSSAGSAVAGSTSAPSSYGIQFIPQPQVMPSQMPSMSLALTPGALSGSSAFIQQPSFVPAPGETLGSAASAASIGPFQQHPMHPPMQGPFTQQQFANYQANPGVFPQQYQQYPQQQFQPHTNQLTQQQQHELSQQQQQQQQQAAAYQLQQQTQHLGLGSGGGSGSSHHSSQYASQRMPSFGSQRDTSNDQPGAGVAAGGLQVPVGGQLQAVPSQGSIHELPYEAGQQVASDGQTTAAGLQTGQMHGAGVPKPAEGH